MSSDYPNLRSLTRCVLCDGAKRVGNIVCFKCWSAFNLRNGIHAKIEIILKKWESTAGVAENLKKSL